MKTGFQLLIIVVSLAFIFISMVSIMEFYGVWGPFLILTIGYLCGQLGSICLRSHQRQRRNFIH